MDIYSRSFLQVLIFNINHIHENKTELNLKWTYIIDHSYKVSIVGGSGSGKTNALLNLINNQIDIDEIYLCAKDPYEAKYQFLTKKKERVGLKHLNDPKVFTEYSNGMQDVYKTLKNTIQVKNVKP